MGEVRCRAERGDDVLTEDDFAQTRQDRAEVRIVQNLQCRRIHTGEEGERCVHLRSESGHVECALGEVVVGEIRVDFFYSGICTFSDNAAVSFGASATYKEEANQ